MAGKFLTSLFVSLALVCSAGSSSFAAQVVGKTEVVKRQVTGAGVQGNRRLSVEDSLFENERISAGIESHGELRLSDDSKIIVGENSSIKLDAFVLGGSGFSNGVVNVTKGAFRFVTGSSQKGAFRVKTPLSTVGIRGTLFDVYVENGRELFVLFNGAIQVCTNAGICQTATRNCDIIEVKSPSEISKEPFFGSARSNLGDGDVSLAGNQQRFQRSWRAPLRACSARAAMEAIEGRSLRDAGDNSNSPEVSNSPTGRSECSSNEC